MDTRVRVPFPNNTLVEVIEGLWLGRLVAEYISLDPPREEFADLISHEPSERYCEHVVKFLKGSLFCFYAFQLKLELIQFTSPHVHYTNQG